MRVGRVNDIAAAILCAWLCAGVAHARAAPPARDVTLHVAGEYRVRAEALSGQFRAGFEGGDQALSLRGLVRGELSAGPLALSVEAIDSRVVLNDTGSPVDRSQVNPLDVLQAHLRWRGAAPRPGWRGEVKLGRMTVNALSRRLVSRNGFRNTINAFTGADAALAGPGGRRGRAFLLMPVERRPGERAALLDNEAELDVETPNAVLWGAAAGRRLAGGDELDVYVIGLREDDRADRATANRRLVTPGVRARRAAKPGRLDYEVEAAAQMGRSRADRAASRDLRHRAAFAHLEAGYTLDRPSAPRLSAEFDYVTGDADPGDDRNGRFDTLFGSRGFDFGWTSLYGAVARGNLVSPGARVEAAPHERVSGFLAYRALWLEEGRDEFAAPGVRDRDGASGRFVGHQLWGGGKLDLAGGKVSLEAGGAALARGRFLREAPNRSGESDAAYGFAQMTVRF
ncbi:MAG: alginate export family protein [Caulobacterales bacterium]|nr:alginate export family protein [Caulobacterales bacterium]